MQKSISFWAQNLDNTSPDHMQHRGVVLDESQQTERQNLAYDISKLSANTKPFFKSPNISVFINGNKFVFSILTKQKDNAGRLATIVGYAQLDNAVTKQDWPHETVSELEAFAKLINRTIAKGALKELETVLVKLKKKTLFTLRKIIIILVLLAVMLILLGSILLLVTKI